MNIIFDEATLGDISRLIELRIAYMIDDFGSVSQKERDGMEMQLPDYFKRKLGTETIVFTARDLDADGIIVATAYLHIIEIPANSVLLNGLYGEVLGVYTEETYRGNGICTRLMQNLVNYGREHGLGRIDLGATKKGYPVYKRVGFEEKAARYVSMRYIFDANEN